MFRSLLDLSSKMKKSKNMFDIGSILKGWNIAIVASSRLVKELSCIGSLKIEVGHILPALGIVGTNKEQLGKMGMKVLMAIPILELGKVEVRE